MWKQTVKTKISKILIWKWLAAFMHLVRYENNDLHVYYSHCVLNENDFNTVLNIFAASEFEQPAVSIAKLVKELVYIEA
jgi:hypothetical protein